MILTARALAVLLPLLLGAELKVRSADSGERDTGLAGPDLEGTWKLTVNVVSAAHVPVLGDTEVRSVKTNVVELSRADGAWEAQHRSCGIEADTEALVQTVIPAAFIASLPVKVYAPSVWEEQGAWHYEVLLPGDYLGMATGASFPTEGEGEVLDTDGDGHPGVTVLLKAPLFGEVEAYMVQESQVRLADGIITGDRVEGGVDLTVLRSSVVGASNPVFALQPRVEAVPGASTFVMERLPEGTRCEHL